MKKVYLAIMTLLSMALALKVSCYHETKRVLCDVLGIYPGQVKIRACGTSMSLVDGVVLIALESEMDIDVDKVRKRVSQLPDRYHIHKFDPLRNPLDSIIDKYDFIPKNNQIMKFYSMKAEVDSNSLVLGYYEKYGTVFQALVFFPDRRRVLYYQVW